MQAILKLDVSGQPRGWLTLNEAVTAYARGDVLYGIGGTLPPVFGGVQRLTGIRSEIILQPIVALQGRVMNHFTPPLCNRTLFRRDDHRCLYCYLRLLYLIIFILLQHHWQLKLLNYPHVQN